jgi:hypothetical protein
MDATTDLLLQEDEIHQDILDGIHCRGIFSYFSISSLVNLISVSPDRVLVLLFSVRVEFRMNFG